MTDHEKDKKMLLTHDEALFGDGNGSKGMVKKVDEMHTYFIEMTTTARVFFMLLKILGVMAASALAVWALKDKIWPQ